MPGSHDDGEITFYEELGVAPQASPEEIRDAFRLFVRLLHPDQQTDPQLIGIAEKQMRKLNRVYAVLSDPERRRRYDELLGDDYSVPIILSSPSPGQRRLMARMAWSAAIVVSAGLLIWLASDTGVQNRAPELNSTPASPSASSTTSPAKLAENTADGDPPASQISQLRSDLSAAIVERDAAIQELNKLRGDPNRSRNAFQPGSSPPVEGLEPKSALTMTELPSSSRPQAAPGWSERPATRQLAGFWFYAKPADGKIDKSFSLYPPEYIEATITEDGAAIQGRYRARFRITGRAVSQDVNFTFTGTRNGPQFNCVWTGAGGAKGEMTVKPMSENSIRIDWTANEIGSRQSLSSGTAVLTRRVE
jgi:curved DNA-binding protein CbpA